MNQTINNRGLALVKSFETCKLVAFRPTPDDVPTIGWGRTKGVNMGDTCTQDQADAWLVEDVKEAEDCVNECVTASLTDNEFSACVSLAYNIGCHAFENSTLVHLLNQADYNGAQAQFARWNKQAGKPLAGLTRRRQAEVQLFESETT